ncbi:hypothetical protein K501DRAFT_172083 [Backusella circina FSU 941]|nr:hypothetical protein K501DRAFT_172083 [Backusella circina FSU 941]
MSEIALTNSTNHHYVSDYSNGSMMININPSLVQKADTSNPSPPVAYEDAYAFQPIPMGYPPVALPNYPMSRLGYYPEPSRQQQPNSPESISSSSSPTPSPPPPTNNISSTSAVNGSRFPNPTTARVKEMITRANSVPMEFYHTEFLEYSKETYEKKMESKRCKRKRSPNSHDDHSNGKKSKHATTNDEEKDQNVSNAEIRRQIHIQSEQKRRAQIKDGFDELRKHLPGCNNKKMSKAALLTRTVQQLQHLKGMQTELLSEVERLIQENEALKKFQHGVLQRQAMEKMYTF